MTITQRDIQYLPLYIASDGGYHQARYAAQRLGLEFPVARWVYLDIHKAEKINAEVAISILHVGASNGPPWLGELYTALQEKRARFQFLTVRDIANGLG